MDSKAFFSLDNLSVWYTAGHPVLSGLSLDLGEHEVVGMIGLNGAGKTTLIKTVAGLLTGYRMDNAVWAGHTFSFRDKAFKRSRYIVFAKDRSFQYFTFREYLAYVAASYGVPSPDISGLVRGFHFENYVNVLLNELSTGNLKKAYLITAFTLRPKLLILDEPVNGLDFQSTEFLYQLMRGYKQYGTILFSSHILEIIHTPICTLLSCDPDLGQAIRVLPGQAGWFCRIYCLFVFIINGIVAGIYLGSCRIIYGGMGLTHVWAAFLFDLQSSILSVILEWKRPIRGWKTESDLWHHPRKYLVPLAMLLMGAFAGTYTSVFGIWSVVLMMECCILLYTTKRE